MIAVGEVIVGAALASARVLCVVDLREMEGLVLWDVVYARRGKVIVRGAWGSARNVVTNGERVIGGMSLLSTATFCEEAKQQLVLIVDLVDESVSGCLSAKAATAYMTPPTAPPLLTSHCPHWKEGIHSTPIAVRHRMRLQMRYAFCSPRSRHPLRVEANRLHSTEIAASRTLIFFGTSDTVVNGHRIGVGIRPVCHVDASETPTNRRYSCSSFSGTRYRLGQRDSDGRSLFHQRLCA